MHNDDLEITQKINLADPFQALDDISYSVSFEGGVWLAQAWYGIASAPLFTVEGLTPVGAIINAEIRARRLVKRG